MFDDLLEPPDYLDCMLEIYNLKAEAKLLSDECLVQEVMEISSGIERTPETDESMSRFFNYGSLEYADRRIVENCYVLLKNFLCLDTNGDVYQTLKDIG